MSCMNQVKTTSSWKARRSITLHPRHSTHKKTPQCFIMRTLRSRPTRTEPLCNFALHIKHPPRARFERCGRSSHRVDMPPAFAKTGPLGSAPLRTMEHSLTQTCPRAKSPHNLQFHPAVMLTLVKLEANVFRCDTGSSLPGPLASPTTMERVAKDARRRSH